MKEFIDGCHFLLIFGGWIVVLAPFAMAGAWVWSAWEHRGHSKSSRTQPMRMNRRRFW